MEDTVAKPAPDRIDPTWPKEEHPLSELCAPVQASFSPFGEVEFPLEEVPYEHPVTEINR
ncbi:MAG: hypothetical protein M3Z25_23860 [Actinomycetota bacterium]|nr:hypothetical protein [Actinomycetota bacterium]